MAQRTREKREVVPLDKPKANVAKQPKDDAKVATLEHRQDAANRLIGGTPYEPFNTGILSQLQGVIWYGENRSAEECQQLVLGAAGALADTEPKDAMEAMLAAQMVATHAASMECYRRAMIPSQTLVGREQALAHANKLTRSFATLTQAFDKHRGRGQQTVRVEHVHVYQGGQAIVGNLSAEARQHMAEAVPAEMMTRGEEKDDD